MKISYLTLSSTCLPPCLSLAPRLSLPLFPPSCWPLRLNFPLWGFASQHISCPSCLISIQEERGTHPHQTKPSSHHGDQSATKPNHSTVTMPKPNYLPIMDKWTTKQNHLHTTVTMPKPNYLRTTDQWTAKQNHLRTTDQSTTKPKYLHTTYQSTTKTNHLLICRRRINKCCSIIFYYVLFNYILFNSILLIETRDFPPYTARVCAKLWIEKTNFLVDIGSEI